MSPEVQRSLDRLSQGDDVCHVVVLPDVHLASDVCVGTVVATQQVIYPAAVGGDIGCGMAALAFHAESSTVDHPAAAARVLSRLYQLVPGNKHRGPRSFPESLPDVSLCDPALAKLARREGRVQLGTLGRGNHFLELQADTQGRLWVMIHSGSRAMGQAIRDWHLRSAVMDSTGLKGLDAKAAEGAAYLADVAWARWYAALNRLEMLRAVEKLLRELFGIKADWSTLIHADHNHVQQETHGNLSYWIHRKGAQSARDGEANLTPGSMGSVSFHTTGRGRAESLASSAHGAGRRLSRTEAKQTVTVRAFERQVGQLWFDHRGTARLLDEAPSAYKDIRAVMKAQRDLICIVRELRPILSYKG
jgi:tRNA-splicing ligase RtcB